MIGGNLRVLIDRQEDVPSWSMDCTLHLINQRKPLGLTKNR